MQRLISVLKQDNVDLELIMLIRSILAASKEIAFRVSQGALGDVLGSTLMQNVQGETQKQLDVISNDLLKDLLLSEDSVRAIASEEEDDVVAGNPNGRFNVAFDPLDGSSNIDVNVSLGTIFSIYKKKSEGDEVVLDDFLQAGTEQVAAGYVLYGTSTLFVYTTGQGVNGFTLNPAIGTFYLSHPNITLPKEGHIYSINEANYASFPQSVKNCLKQRKAEDLNYTTRYIGSMVSDIHRNILKGGLFLYPPNAKSPQGKLRLLYECNPIAFIVEQAGGMAVSMDKRIMEIQPTELHQREPFFCGNSEMIQDLQYHLQKGE